MNLEDVHEYVTVRDGICPHTGTRYDCSRCNVIPPYLMGERESRHHMSMSIKGAIERDRERGFWLKMAHCVTIGGKNPTPKECRELFIALHGLGVECIPMDSCDNFCYKHGCMGHVEKKEGAK